MEVYFIRRAQTDFDFDNIYRDNDSDSLTEIGKKQAEREGVNLMRRKLTHVFSSPCKRARETAQVIGDLLKIKVEVLEDLRARDLAGILAGRDLDEALENDYDLVAKLQNWQDAVEGAEDYQVFLNRIRKILAVIAKTKKGNVAVITHTSVLSAIARDILMEGELYNVGECATLKLDYNAEEGWKMADLKKGRLVRKDEAVWF